MKIKTKEYIKLSLLLLLSFTLSIIAGFIWDWEPKAFYKFVIFSWFLFASMVSFMYMVFRITHKEMYIKDEKDA